MGRETSQFNLSDRQMRAAYAQSRDVLTDIGEAKVIHTIFGRAKVQIIRKQDQVRRTWMLMALAIVVTVLVAALWNGWMVLPTTELLQSATPHTPLSVTVQVTAPVPQPESISPAASTLPVASKTPLPTEFNTASQKNAPQSPQSAPQLPPVLQAPGQMAAKPVAAKPLLASKPQMMPPATNNNVPKSPAVMQQPPKLSPPTRPVVPTIVVPPAAQPVAPSVAVPAASQSATPAVVTLPATQPATNKPATVAQPVEPLIKKDTSTLSSPGGNPAPGSVNEQPQINSQP